jgi:hypothetical protein
VAGDGESYRVGGGSNAADLDALIRKAQEGAQATDELNRKEEQRRSIEEQTTSVEEQSSAVRTGLAGSTRELSSALTRNIATLGEETAAVRANTAELERNLATRIAIIEASGGASSFVATGATRIAAPTGGGGGRPPRPPIVASAGGFEEDPGAASRAAAARQALAQAEVARAAATAEAASQTRAAARGEGVDPTAAIEQREIARQQVQAARQELASAERAVQANQQIAAEKARQQEASAQAARAAQQEAAAQLAAAQEAQRIQQSLAAQEATAREQQAQSLSGLVYPPGLAQSAFRPPLFPRAVPTDTGVPHLGPSPNVVGGPTSPLIAPNEDIEVYRQRATANAEALAGLEEKQLQVNRTFQEAGAIYSDTSTRLSRHGALTTEFIQSLASGQVSLREFGEQMTSTIGKFGGWAIAGAAVYGVYGMFKDLTEGATETQAALQNLGRFIPGLGGPAGGGTGSLGAATQQLRSISTQFNLPISEVGDVQQVAARRYPTLGASGDVTRAILAAYRLDQIPTDQGEQYILGIASSLGLNPTGSGTGSVIGLVNSLNALQSEGGARVAQTLPAVARAAPIARAEGMSTEQLTALAALGVRAGIPGAQVGTALLRSAGTFAFRPASEVTLRELGIAPQIGQVGDLYSQVFALLRSGRAPVAGQPGETRPLTGIDLRNLSQALGGPLLGSRSILPILAQEYRQPGTYDRFLNIANHPRPYQEDLNAVLGTVSERFKAIGIALQSFGSELAQAGALAPITGFLDAIRLATGAIQRLTSPIVDVLGVFNRLPGVVRDAIGVFLGVAAIRRVLNTRLGGVAQSFIGRLPGLEGVQARAGQQAAVQGTQRRIERELLPAQEADYEAANRARLRAVGDQAAAVNRLAAYQQTPEARLASTQAEGTDAREQYEEAVASQLDRIAQLDQRAAAATARWLEEAEKTSTLQAQLNVFKDDQLTWAQRAAVLEEQGFVAQSATVDRTAALTESLTARARQLGRPSSLGGGGGSLAGEGEVASAAGVAAVTTAVVNNVVNDQAAMDRITEATDRARQQVPVPPVQAAEEQGRIAATAQAVRDRTGSIRDSAAEAGGWRSYLGQQASSFASSGAAPFAALLATQAVGGGIGGGVGSYISNVGGEAATGAIIAQMLGKGGGPGIAAGAALGTVAGSFQQSTTSGAFASGGLALGAAIGGLLGAGAFSIPGALIGGAIGSGVGGVVGAIFGSGTSPQDAQNAANMRARRQTLDLSAPTLQSRFNNDLEAAFSGTGQSQSSAQARVSALINRLTSEVQLYGSTSGQGVVARQQLDALVGGALAQAGQDPTSAFQIIQAATQARNQVITQGFQYRLSQSATPRQALAASGADIARTNQTLQPYEQTVKTQQDALAQDRQTLTDAVHARAMGAARLAQQQVTQDEQALSAARNLAGIAHASAVLNEQQAAEQAYTQAIQDASAQGTLSASRAGGSQLGQLAAQRRTLESQLRITQGDHQIRPDQRRTQLETLRGQLNDNTRQAAAAQLAEVQAQGQLLVSTAPVGDTVAQAQLTAQAAQSALSYMRSNAHQFDPAQIAQAAAQVNDAERQLTQAIADRATQMAQLAGQLAQARDFGNAIAQARDALAAGQAELAAAVTPIERLQAQGNIQQAIDQQYQAQQQHIQAEGQLQQALAGGNQVAQAQVAQQTAQALLGSAHGIDNQIAAEAALAQANLQYRQALEARYQSLGQLAASTTSSPLQQLLDQMAGVTRALGVAQGPDQRIQLQTQLNNLKLQYQSTLIQQREATTEFQLNMYQITYAQAIKQLEDLLHVRDITLQQKQQIQERIRQLEQTDTGGGQFDLAPDLAQHLKLPTPYDVARAIHTANQEFGRRMSQGYNQGLTDAAGYGAAATSHHYNSSDTFNFTVNVRNGSDAGRVVDQMDHLTGGRLKSRLRAAGFRGT